MAGDSAQERTEQATPKRLAEAKRKGQVARSRELNTAMMLTAAALALYLLGPIYGQGLGGLMEWAFVLEPADATDPSAMLRRFQAAAAEMLLLFVPFVVVVVVTALATPALLGGWSMSSAALAPKLDRLDPIKGLGRIFSLRGLVELVKAVAKLVLVAGGGGAFLWLRRDEILAPPTGSLAANLLHAFELFGVLLIVLALATFVIALIDVPYQLWQHQKQLRMTRQEVRDESKQTEGSPEVKGRIRRLQRERAMQRMMEEVPKADVVVTNPTHYAVALRYEPLKGGAPRVVAKGADLIAGHIRKVAQAHRVPVVEVPPLARALYHGVKLDQEIPASLYLAVAQLLAYVYQLRAAWESGAPAPDLPADLPIPDENLGR